MLKFDTTAVSYDYGMVEYKDGAELRLRPFPASKGSFEFNVKEDTMRLAGAEQFKIFNYCLGGCDGIDGADDKPLKLTDDVKKKIFDFRFRVENFNDMVTFVLNWNQQALEKKAGLLGNSSSSPDGSGNDQKE